jgi:hypothetical protein
LETGRVESTTGEGAEGEWIGPLDGLLIENFSGRVAYAVIAFEGFLDLAADAHTIPWGKLTDDTSLGDSRSDIQAALLMLRPPHSLRLAEVRERDVELPCEP